MVTIKHLLDEKGREIYSIHPDATVFAALKRMAEKNVGSIAVIENGKLLGLFTERLYAREIALKGRTSPQTQVREVMAKRVQCVRPDQTVEECMSIMTVKTVRHLVVMEDGELAGIISIGDLVKSHIGDQRFIIDQLESYIHGLR